MLSRIWALYMGMDTVTAMAMAMAMVDITQMKIHHLGGNGG